MKAEPYYLRLRHAPRGDHGRSYDRFLGFVTGANEAHVSIRPEQVIRTTIQEQNLFFLENSEGDLVGTTGFYRHGDYTNFWAELGSTLIHPAYRGFQLQRVMYQYIIVHEWLAAPTFDPVIAVVDVDAAASNANIEQCGFAKLDSAPSKLVEAKPDFDWSMVNRGQIRLYQLTRRGIVSALSYVAQSGAQQRLLNKRSGAHLALQAEFPYLNNDGISKELQLEAERVAATGERITRDRVAQIK